MIRGNKVKTMTKAAIWEEKEKRKSFSDNRYYRADFILYGMIRSAVSITIACLLGFVIYAGAHGEELLTRTSVEELIALGFAAVKWYALIFVLFMAVSLVIYQIQYTRAQKRVREYRGLLRRLIKVQQSRADAKERSL